MNRVPRPGELVIIGPEAADRQDFLPVAVHVVAMLDEPAGAGRVVLRGWVIDRMGGVVGELIAPVWLDRLVWP